MLCVGGALWCVWCASRARCWCSGASVGALVGAGIFAGGVCAWLMRVVFLSCVWGGRVGDGVGGALAAGCAGGRGSAWWGVGGRTWRRLKSMQKTRHILGTCKSPWKDWTHSGDLQITMQKTRHILGTCKSPCKRLDRFCDRPFPPPALSRFKRSNPVNQLGANSCQWKRQALLETCTGLVESELG